jgi:hypothetical protein
MGKRRTELHKPNMLLSDLELEANFFLPVTFSQPVEESAGLVTVLSSGGEEPALRDPIASNVE